MVAIRDRVKEFRRVKAGTLRPSPKNWRTHPKGQLDALRGVLADIGFAGACLARELPDGTLELIDGHARAETVPGDTEVPVLVLDVTEAEADTLLATFDPIGAMAGADADKLDALLRGVQTGNEAVAALLEATAVDAGAMPNVGAADLPTLPTGDRQPFQQMTFTLADEQAVAVKDALAKAKADGGDTSDVNENSNGNALARIAETYLADR
jgi:hypothetical protein